MWMSDDGTAKGGEICMSIRFVAPLLVTGAILHIYMGEPDERLALTLGIHCSCVATHSPLS